MTTTAGTYLFIARVTDRIETQTAKQFSITVN
jgi:hypothetical protein